MTAAGGKLAVSMTLVDPNKGFGLVTFEAGSTPPAWARTLITNPKAWETAPESSPTPEDQDPGDEDLIGEPEGSASAPEVQGDGEQDADASEQLSMPAKRGAGSGRDAWVAYADQEGVEYADGASRDEIMAAVEAASSD